MRIHFTPLPTDHVRALQRGEKDCYGNLPDHRTSDGDGNSCRPCLTNRIKSVYPGITHTRLPAGLACR